MINKGNMKCGQDTRSLRICLLDDKTIGFFHCCFKYEICNTLAIDEFYKMTNTEFMNFLNETYKIMPQNHDYTIYPYCKSKLKKCIYNDKYVANVVVDVFQYCNIKCHFCLLTDLVHPLTLAENRKLYFEILNKIKGNNLNVITTTGAGEPFLCKKETLDYIKNLTINDCKYFLIVTNSTLLTEKDIEEIYEVKNKTGIEFRFIASCSAITPETYKKVHCNNKFDTVVNNIKAMYKFGLLDFVNFVAEENNIHELYNYRNFWHNNGITDDKKLVISAVHGNKNKDILDTEEWKLYGN